MAELEVQGLDQLLRNLATFPDRVERKVVRRAVNRFAAFIVKAFKRAAPVDEGDLKRAQGKRESRRLSRELGGIVVLAGTRKGRAPHAHLVEGGTVERFTRTGKSTGVMPAAHVFERAFDANVGAGEAVMASTIAEGIEIEAGKQS